MCCLYCLLRLISGRSIWGSYWFFDEDLRCVDILILKECQRRLHSLWLALIQKLHRFEIVVVLLLIFFLLISGRGLSIADEASSDISTATLSLRLGNKLWYLVLTGVIMVLPIRRPNSSSSSLSTKNYIGVIIIIYYFRNLVIFRNQNFCCLPWLLIIVFIFIFSWFGGL